MGPKVGTEIHVMVTGAPFRRRLIQGASLSAISVGDGDGDVNLVAGRRGESPSNSSSNNTASRLSLMLWRGSS